MAILFTQAVSHHNGVSLGFQRPRWKLDPWVYELPDSHFDVKQFAFRVTALANGFPLEEPLLWCALNPDGYPHPAIRSAPVQESHPLTPFFPDRQEANVCPWRTNDSTAGPPGGWLFSCVSTSHIEPDDLTCGPNDSVRFPIEPKQEFLPAWTDREQAVALNNNTHSSSGRRDLRTNSASAGCNRIDDLLGKGMEQNRSHSFAARDYRMERLAPANPALFLAVAPTANDRLQGS